MERLIAAAFAVLLLSGCGDDDAPAEPQALGDELGCDSFDQAETEEMYVQERYTCERDGETTDVYAFNSSSARDSWREIAEEFGTVVLDEGDTWLEVD